MPAFKSEPERRKHRTETKKRRSDEAYREFHLLNTRLMSALSRLGRPAPRVMEVACS